MRISDKKLYIQCAKKGWNYSDLAKALGVTRTVVYGYKNRNLRTDTLHRIAKTLGCEPEDLLELGGDGK